jgi:predicted dithiol-disulfide oxidoreductase (DUF899 family)
LIKHEVVSQDAWLRARRELLAKEKELTRLRDELSESRRQLPWVKIDKPYVFDGPNGKETLGDLFAGRRQLIVQHFMFAPDWDAGCKSCSFWADNFNGITAHLNQRDVTFVAISRAPLKTLEAFEGRMGWKFKWLSSLGSDFNFDFGVSATPEEISKGQVTYNYASRKPFSPEMPGLSVFYKDDDGTIYHTYSCYARGLDMLNAAYHLLDLVPKGRDEAALSYPMAWVKLRDQYAA